MCFLIHKYTSVQFWRGKKVRVLFRLFCLFLLIISNQEEFLFLIKNKSKDYWMWSQLLLSKLTRPLLTHQSQEAIIIPSLYRMPFLPRKLQSSLLMLRLCSCQERNVAPLTSKGGSEVHGEPLTHSGHTLLPLYQSPPPKLWFGGKKTGEAAVVPSYFHPSPSQTS